MIQILFTFFPLLLLINFVTATANIEICDRSDGILTNYQSFQNCRTSNILSKRRYILYDTNPQEGFNLRRDVYIRVAVFLKKLLEDKEFEWHLVLPPWGRLYHWRSRDIVAQNQLPWGLFFDISSLRKYIPVMEMYQFIKEYPSMERETILDIVYVLQNDEEMFKTGEFKNKNKVFDCPKGKVPYKKLGKDEFSGNFWGFSNITARNLKCIVFHGTASDLRVNLKPNLYRSVLFDRMEIALHDFYGSKDYWMARRSMRFNPELYEIAREFRKNELNSEDRIDRTERPADWREESEITNGQRGALGGPYLAVHLRRRDFLYGRSKFVPTIVKAASQLRKILEELRLEIVFIATDAEDHEYSELEKYLQQYIVKRFIPSESVKHKFKDGGIAIIEQIICSHARYFIGTYESTFTFRIQEEREIIGFPTGTTFNRLCGDEKKCLSSGKWEIVW